jgi:hypothetical protein
MRSMSSGPRRVLKRYVPERAWRPVVTAVRRARRPQITADALLEPVPLSRIWGLDRGTPIDRYYMERFLEEHCADIRGRTLEMADPRYTRRFGGDRVTHSDVLHYVAGNRLATLVGDLVTGEGVPRTPSTA